MPIFKGRTQSRRVYTGDDGDIALIRVATPMTIPPVPLPANYSHPKDEWLRSAGYGTTKYKIINETYINFTDQATSLMEIYLHGAVGKDCLKPSFLEERPHLNVICLGKSNSSLLAGDSGGPTFAQGKDDKWYQVGVTSFGWPLSGTWLENISWSLALEHRFPFISAVTDVSHYCPWIEETTGGEVKCQTFDPPCWAVCGPDTNNETRWSTTQL
uniref:Peptidase S1 domain-containing protein n=1 Tax=Panagrolaimus sp. JU765 TaxID=591449 RepID=A0AC34Q6Z1_9BILA